jgi:signal transduction histidine kinase
MSWLAGRSARARLALLYAAVVLAVVVGLLVVLVLIVNVAAPTVHVAVANPTPIPFPHNATRTLLVPAGGTVVRAQRAADISRLLLISVILMALTLLGAIPLGWFASGRMLRPLRQITARARTISAGNLHERLAISGERDEFTELGDTLDDLLARLETSFDAQRRFVANASHELRTPLTVERTLLQVALADPNASAATLRATCEELLANGRDQERLIEALLTLASSERGLERRERVDLAVLATRVLERPHVELDQHRITLDAALEPAITEGDAELLERLITNLVDNALAHNVVGGHVQITTRQQGDRALLMVENSGQMIAPDDIETMFEPFRRLGPARTGTGSGQHGLGLSIVRAIAEAHQAQIDARPRPAGGLLITLAFPAPGPERADGAQI